MGLHQGTAPAFSQDDISHFLHLCLTSDAPHGCDGFVRAARTIIAATIMRTTQASRQLAADEVEDLVQETFVKLFGDDKRVLRRIRAEHPGALVVYLKTVAASVTADSLAARGALRRGREYGHKPLHEVLELPHDCHTTNPMEREILLREIARYLDQKPGVTPRDKSIFWLHYRHGFTARAISEICSLKLTQKGVEAAIQRLLQIVRDRFKEPPLSEGKGG